MLQDSLHIAQLNDSIALPDSAVSAPPSYVYLPPLKPDTSATGYLDPLVALSPVIPQPDYSDLHAYELSTTKTAIDFYRQVNSPLADSLRVALNDSAFQARQHQTACENYTSDRQAYSVSSDDYITAILLVCTFLAAYVIIHGKKFLHNHDLIPSFHKKVVDKHNVRTSLEIHGILFLILETCFTMGIISTSLIVRMQTDYSLTGTPYELLIGTSLFFLVFYLAKLAFYGFVNSIFFDRVTVIRWNDTYLFSIFIQGVLLLPVTLLVIYSAISVDVLLIAWLTMLFVSKAFLINQSFSVFPKKNATYLHILLYLCSVEILPPILVWHALTNLLDSLFVPQTLF